jgi:hypothetical protein
MKYQGLREVFKVIEWKDGCVFRTKKIGFAWVTIGTEPERNYDGNIQFHSVSTNLSKMIKTNRTVPDETPDIDITTFSKLTNIN